MAVDRLDGAERLAAQPDHDPRDAAVADDDVRGEADRRHWNFAWQRPQEIGEVFLVGGLEQELRRPADAKPRVRRERRIGAQLAAQSGDPSADLPGDVGESHLLSPAASSPGSAEAHWVMLPPPTRTHKYPACATPPPRPPRP